jgi:MoaA/NifB/PqqE/SkfB family radical SAM enzyme
MGLSDASGVPGDGKDSAAAFSWKLWIYTNYDCNLSCSYCLAESSPRAKRRGLDLATVRQAVDEAVALGFEHIFLTGGEPFLLDDVYEMLSYASARVPTTVLTNGTLLRGRRLARLNTIANPNLTVQVSLDGAQPEHHDPYRGRGAWAAAVEGIKLLRGQGFHIHIGTTETPANATHLDELAAFLRSLGIPKEDHISRPVTRRGFATEGMEVGTDTLTPELTLTVAGVFWHPLASPSSADMQVGAQIFPLADAVARIQQELVTLAEAGKGQPKTVT